MPNFDANDASDASALFQTLGSNEISDLANQIDDVRHVEERHLTRDNSFSPQTSSPPKSAYTVSHGPLLSQNSGDGLWSATTAGID